MAADTPPAPIITIPKKASTTGKGTTALAWDGTKKVPTTDLKKQYQLLPAQQKKALIDYAASVGKTPADAPSIWSQLVNASQASVQQGKPLSPWEVLSRARSQGIPVTQGAPATARTTSYNDTVADSLVRAAYAKIFNRIPTDLDLQGPANVKDPATGEVMKDPKTGQPLTWQQALQKISSNPDFQETSSYTVDANGNVKTITSKPAMDPTTWLQTAMTSSYADAIKAGTLPAEAKMEQTYAQLAAEYGLNAYDPLTKELTPSAKIDLAQLEKGTKDMDQIKQSWSNLALPKVASAAADGLKSGAATLKGYASPAIDRVATLLGLNPATVTVNHPIVQKYLAGDGKNFMSPGELDSTIMNDPQYKFGQHANAKFDDLASSILQRFGVNA
jgi:hypothetical protein